MFTICTVNLLWNINQLLCFSLVAFILGGSDNLNTELIWFLQGTKKHQFCERSAGVAYGVVISLFHGLIFYSWYSLPASSPIWAMRAPTVNVREFMSSNSCKIAFANLAVHVPNADNLTRETCFTRPNRRACSQATPGTTGNASSTIKTSS